MAVTILIICASLLIIAQSVALFIIGSRLRNATKYLNTFSNALYFMFLAVRKCKDTMDTADAGGHFKVDDEVGITFDIIKDAIDHTSTLISTYINLDDEKTTSTEKKAVL